MNRYRMSSRSLLVFANCVLAVFAGVIPCECKTRQRDDRKDGNQHTSHRNILLRYPAEPKRHSEALQGQQGPLAGRHHAAVDKGASPLNVGAAHSAFEAQSTGGFAVFC